MIIKICGGCRTLDLPSCSFMIISESSAESVVDIGCRLANQMRMLNYTQWMNLVTTLFSNLMTLLGRVRVCSIQLPPLFLLCMDGFMA